MSDNVTSLGRSPRDIPVILVVGDLRGWMRSGRQPPDLHGFHFAGIADVTAETLERIAPDVVLSALFTAEFDALDLARLLADLGFCGRYRALSQTLPRPAVIRSEVSGVAPDLDFDLFILDEVGSLPNRR